ncbi:hypothetical protein MY5147_006333 [Beauveria neobassiana]
MAKVTTPLLAGHLPGPNVTHDHLRGMLVAWLSSSGILTAIHRYKEFRDHPIWFLIFHFGTVTFVLHFVFQIITFVTVTDLFGHGWLRSFSIFSTYTMPAVSMLIETMFFNSIKRPQNLITHMLGLSGFSVLYLIWGVIGGHLSGCYPFYWLNPMFIGGIESVAAHCMGFVALAPLTFIMMQGFTALREGLTAPAR